MSTNISLYLITKNKYSNEYEIISTSQNELVLPEQTIVLNTDIQSNCFDLYKKYIDIHENIFPCIYLDCHITDYINILFFSIIPYNFSTKNVFFIPMKNIKNEFHIKNLQKIINII